MYSHAGKSNRKLDLKNSSYIGSSESPQNSHTPKNDPLQNLFAECWKHTVKIITDTYVPVNCATPKSIYFYSSPFYLIKICQQDLARSIKILNVDKHERTNIDMYTLYQLLQKRQSIYSIANLLGLYMVKRIIVRLTQQIANSLTAAAAERTSAVAVRWVYKNAISYHSAEDQYEHG